MEEQLRLGFDSDARRPILYCGNKIFMQDQPLDVRYFQFIADQWQIVGLSSVLEVFAFSHRLNLISFAQIEQIFPNLIQQVGLSGEQLTIPLISNMMKCYQGVEISLLLINQVNTNLSFNDQLLTVLIRKGTLFTLDLFVQCFCRVLETIDLKHLMQTDVIDSLAFVHALGAFIVNEQINKVQFPDIVIWELSTILLLFKPCFAFQNLSDKVRGQFRSIARFATQYSNFIKQKDDDHVVPNLKPIYQGTNSIFLPIFDQTYKFCTVVVDRERQNQLSQSMCSKLLFNTIFCMMSQIFLISQKTINIEAQFYDFVVDYLNQMPNSLVHKHYYLIDHVADLDQIFVDQVLSSKNVFELFVKLLDQLKTGNDGIRLSQFQTQTQTEDPFVYSEYFINKLDGFNSRFLISLKNQQQFLLQNNDKLNAILKKFNQIKAVCNISECLVYDLMISALQEGCHIENKIVVPSQQVLIDYYDDQSMYISDFNMCFKYSNPNQITDCLLLTYTVHLSIDYAERNFKLHKLNFESYIACDASEQCLQLLFRNLQVVIYQNIQFLQENKRIILLVQLISNLMVQSQIQKQSKYQNDLIDGDLMIIAIYTLSSLSIKSLFTSSFESIPIDISAQMAISFINRLTEFHLPTIQIFCRNLMQFFQTKQQNNDQQLIQQLLFYYNDEVDFENLSFGSILMFINLHPNRLVLLLPEYLEQLSSLIGKNQYNLIRLGYLYITVCLLLCVDPPGELNKRLIQLEKQVLNKSQVVLDHFNLFMRHYLQFNQFVLTDMSALNKLLVRQIICENNVELPMLKIFRTIYELTMQIPCTSQFEISTFVSLLAFLTKQKASIHAQLRHAANSIELKDYLDQSPIYNVIKLFYSVINTEIANSSYTASQQEEQIVKLLVEEHHDVSRKLCLFSNKSVTQHLIHSFNDHIDLFQTQILYRTKFQLSLLKQEEIVSFILQLFNSKISFVFPAAAQNFSLAKQTPKTVDTYIVTIGESFVEADYVISQLIQMTELDQQIVVQLIIYVLNFINTAGQLLFHYAVKLSDQYVTSNTSDFHADKNIYQMMTNSTFEAVINKLLEIQDPKLVNEAVVLLNEILLSRTNVTYAIAQIAKDKGAVQSLTYLKAFVDLLKRKNMLYYVNFVGHLAFENSSPTQNSSTFFNELCSILTKAEVKFEQQQILVFQFPEAVQLQLEREIILSYRPTIYCQHKTYVAGNVQFIYNQLGEVVLTLLGTQFGQMQIVATVGITRDKMTYKRYSDYQLVLELESESLQQLTFRNIIITIICLLKKLTSIEVTGNEDCFISEIQEINVKKNVCSLFDVILGSYVLSSDNFYKKFNIKAIVDSQVLQQLQISQQDLADFTKLFEDSPLFQMIVTTIQVQLQRIFKQSPDAMFVPMILQQ